MKVMAIPSKSIFVECFVMRNQVLDHYMGLKIKEGVGV